MSYQVPVPVATQFLQGINLLRNRQHNKGTAFTKAERVFLNLEGLMPVVVRTQEQQVEKVIKSLRLKSTDLERYVSLASLQARNQKLFYATIQSHVEELLPIVYTPTVGLACQKFGNNYQESRGMYISIEHKGRIRQILRHWDSPCVKAIVFTDGERILGLGDLGASGMGIPIGKMALYTALGGVNPQHCLPVTLDVGTDNENFLTDPMYHGIREKRVRGEAYDEFVDEFIQAARAEYGSNVLLQFEDFANRNAFRLLDKYKDQCCTFNDDIQGTAGVVTAGVLAAVPQSKVAWKDHRFLFYGAGSAGLGIAHLIAAAWARQTGCTVEEARANIWCIDSRGLVYKGRASGGISSEKEPFAHEWADADSLGGEKQPLEVYCKSLGITGIFGVSAQPQVFTEAAVKQLMENCPHPIVFALSNPTSKAECTAAQAYEWTEGNCLFASGSPFPTYTLPNGDIRVPGQGNNSYVFPGVALAILATGSRRVTDNMFLTAATTLAGMVSDEQIKNGTLYPPLTAIRDVSAVIAAAVCEEIYDSNYATVLPKPDNVKEFIKSQMWSCKYESFCPPELEKVYPSKYTVEQ